ncbi:MAG: glycosyltransferase family 39 protein, partial [Magnetospirillum sp.]|nr:glycosyltransferase family 39 protein [Magnetospirillum sp.]
RLGGNPATMAAAALLFAAQRVVLNLGSAVTTDIPLAAYVTAATVVALVLHDKPQARLTILLGMLVGGMLGIKYHGSIAAAALLTVFTTAALARKRSPRPFIGAGILGLMLISPLLVRNAIVTGNPIFPTLHQHFGPFNVDIFAPLQAALMAREAIPGGLWALPWSMHIHQNSFDGLQFGFPFALAAIPFAFSQNTGRRLFCLAIWIIYGVLWWLVMPHLLRFHLPIMGVITALTALGLAHMAAAARRSRFLMSIWVGFLAVGVAVQGLFVISTTSYRLPVLLGQVTTEQALEAPAFVYYSLVSPCRWIEARLQPGERYLALINDPSVYCPQASALPELQEGEAAAYYTRTPPQPYGPAELARRLEEGNVRYVLVAANLGSDDEPYVFAKHRFDAAASSALMDIQPLLSAPSGRVYDGHVLAQALRHRSE